MAAEKKKFEVLEAGFINGVHYDKGAVDMFDPAAVRWYVEPYGQRLREVGAKAAAPAVKVDAKASAATDPKKGR